MKKVLATVLVILVAGGLVWKVATTPIRYYLAPPEMLGGAIRIVDGDGDRLYYLTSQWEKRLSRSTSRSSSSTRTLSWLNVDLWTLDPATAQPLSRRRIKRDKVNGDLAAMGVEHGVLWARIPELTGIRLSDGAIVANSQMIEARNPGLAGLMPAPPALGTFLTQEMQPLKFNQDVGLMVLLADARRVRIDPRTLEATPWTPPPRDDRGKPVPPPRAMKARLSPPVPVSSIGIGMDWRTMVRGVIVQRRGGGQDWVGLLADNELDDARRRKSVSNDMDFTQPRRHRLYRGRLQNAKNFFGPILEFHDPELLPESPDFLMAGLLTQETPRWQGNVAMWRREPESVFVLSRDRLGAGGRLQVARVTGPDGRPAWTISTPLTDLNGWFPGEHHALMIGPEPSAPRYANAEEGESQVPHLLSIDLATGAMRSFNPDLHRDWPVTMPASESTP